VAVIKPPILLALAGLLKNLDIGDVVIVTRLDRPRTNYAATLSGYPIYRHVSEAHA
jgi:hypothetical protein